MKDNNKTITLVNLVNDGAFYRNTRMPALSLAYIAAYIPKHWSVRIVDETVESFNAFKHAQGSDIVGISGGNVCNAEHAKDVIADIQGFDSLEGTNTTILLGGYIAGLNLNGLQNRVDSTIIGPGELAIQEALHDFEKGTLKKLYTGVRLPMNQLKTPDFSGFDIGRYGKNVNWPVQTSVSCNKDCGFCSARYVFGDGYADRSVDKTMADILNLGKGVRLYFTDPNLVHFSPKGIKRAQDFFKRLAKQGNSWFGSVNFSISQHPELLSAMQESGCTGLLIGFDSASEESLQTMSKGKAHIPNGKSLQDFYIDGVKTIQEKYGINVLGTFVMGFDTDTDATFESTSRVVNESKMKDAQYLMFTPLPGTSMFDTLDAEGRIFDRNFEHYDFTDVVFVPQSYSPRELRNKVVALYEETLPDMLKIYRRMGAIRDRPEEIRVKSMQQRADEALRTNQGGH